ncbi:MAG: amidohydrolase family protein [Dehalococcoidia bacterium]|nr:amidohydrolase family protein [Dehalococcoidia bacterium]
MKIDLFNHVIPKACLDLLQANLSDQGLVKRMSNIRILWDIEARVEMLGQWPDLQQVLTLSNPPPEAFGDLAVEYARTANDAMAEICARWPQRFPAFVASLPWNDPATALTEMDRAVEKLGARGVQTFTNVNDRPLDEPEFFPILERAVNHHGLAVWMHPARNAGFSDYKTEPKSRYEIWQVMGWPYETTAAMSRLVFSGLLDRLPGLRVVTHHCGGMLPFFSGRAETLWAQIGSRTADEDYSALRDRYANESLLDMFRRFYGDTVLGGSTPALRCGLDFFGADHVVFASDCPFDPEGGPMFIREAIRSIEELGLSDADKEKIYAGNAMALLGLIPDKMP